MKKFTKKPVTVEAMQLEQTAKSQRQVLEWCDGSPGPDGGVYIHTLEGKMYASTGDWVIKGIKGEFYPCKPDIFAATYVSNSQRTWQERVREELEELRNKQTSLEIFMRSEALKALDVDNRRLLIDQMHFMSGYASTLSTRLAIN